MTEQQQGFDWWGACRKELVKLSLVTGALMCIQLLIAWLFGKGSGPFAFYIPYFFAFLFFDDIYIAWDGFSLYRPEPPQPLEEYMTRGMANISIVMIGVELFELILAAYGISIDRPHDEATMKKEIKNTGQLMILVFLYLANLVLFSFGRFLNNVISSFIAFWRRRRQ